MSTPRPETAISLPPVPQANAPTGPIAPTSGPAQTVTPGRPVAAKWWMTFGSDTLNKLVDWALAANNDLSSADAALRQAQALARVAAGSAVPAVDVGNQVQRAKVSNSLTTPLADSNATLYTLNTATISVSYPVDLFGGVRSKTRSARAAAEAQRFRYQAARTTVIANVVLAVVQHASLVAQIAAANDSIRANREVLVLLRRRQALGAIGAADVAVQETALATAEGVLPPLDRARVHQEALIAILTGVSPGSAMPRLPGLSDLTLPQDLPLSLPSELVGHRPDIRASDAQMRGAAADVGTAIAARLPGIQLSANIGGSAPNFADMFTSGNLFWSLLGGITQPFFHGGALRAQQAAAEAALDGAKAQYRTAVLQAFVEVSDALTGLHSDAESLDAATRGDAAAAQNLRYVRRQLELGDVGTLALLNANAARAQAAALLVQVRAARMSDTAALYQALGGSE